MEPADLAHPGQLRLTEVDPPALHARGREQADADVVADAGRWHVTCSATVSAGVAGRARHGRSSVPPRPCPPGALELLDQLALALRQWVGRWAWTSAWRSPRALAQPRHALAAQPEDCGRPACGAGIVSASVRPSGVVTCASPPSRRVVNGAWICVWRSSPRRSKRGSRARVTTRNRSPACRLAALAALAATRTREPVRTPGGILTSMRLVAPSSPEGERDRRARVGVGQADLERVLEVRSGARPRRATPGGASRGAPRRRCEERLEEVRERRFVAEQVPQVVLAGRAVLVADATRGPPPKPAQSNGCPRPPPRRGPAAPARTRASATRARRTSCASRDRTGPRRPR